MKIYSLIVLSITSYCLNAHTDDNHDSALHSNEPNYFVMAKDDHDDWHQEFNLSIQYPLAIIDERNELLFIYNGTYDFYFGTRSSSPVISRRQNPGLAIEHTFNSQNAFSTRARVGWYHESNGQTIETRDAWLQHDFARDHVSRGWDYLGFNYYFQAGNTKQELDLRFYCDCQAVGLESGREDNIFWQSVSEQPKVNDYDGIRWKIDAGALPYQLSKLASARIEFKLGNREPDAFKNVSGKITFYKLFHPESPFTLFYFNGYGKELASYHKKNSYIGFGFELR